jgi:hypothetical protein
MKTTFVCTTVVKVVPHGQGLYHVVVIPKEVSQNIRLTYGVSARGFGAVPVLTTIGTTTWSTSIFPDRRSQTYLLLLNKKVRSKETILEGDELTISIELISNLNTRIKS